MANPEVVTREKWLVARKAHLEKEKELTRLRDELSRARRELPWVRVEKEYVFQGPNGDETFSDLFEGKSQLIVYHFMFHPSWKEGCKSCSYWADNYAGINIHLNQRDVNMVTISKAPLEQLDAFKKRMGWRFKWVSSADNDFNRDYHVSFTAQEIEKGEMYYNYRTTRFPMEEAPGLSVFAKDEAGSVFHTYSCYSRGLDMLNGAYHHLDLVPKGRDEDKLSYTMEWIRIRDQYDA